MYYWIVTADKDWRGPYNTADMADSKLESHHDIVFGSSYRNLSKAKQEFRERNAEWRRRNFKAGVQ